MNYSTSDFLSRLFHDKKITFRAIQENGKGRANTVKFSHLDEAFIKYHNSKESGRAVFYMPNSSGSSSTKDADIKHFNTCFIDIDDGALPKGFLLEPTCICSRADGKGHHVYWFIHAHDNAEEWTATQKALIKFYRSDRSIHNPARLMRVPGTINRKPEKDGQIYSIVELNSNCYSLNEVVAAHTDKKKLIEPIRRNYAKHLFTGLDKSSDKGAIHIAMIKVVNRMNGLGFSDDDIFSELEIINKKYFENTYSEKSLRNKVGAKKYAKNKKGAELLEEQVAEVARQERVEEALKDWYYIQRGNFFLNQKSHELERTKEGFNAAFSEIAGIAQVANYAFLHGLIKQAEQIVYEPGEERVLTGVLGTQNINIWTDDRVKPDDTPHDWFLNHLNYLMKPDEVEHFLNWMAYAVQNPGKKILHAILLIGGFGVGKSILNPLYAKLFGGSNVNNPQNENLSDKYTKWAKHTALCIINELKQDGNHHFYNAIKPFITDETIEIREMYRDPYTIRNVMNILAYSNEEAPIKLEEGDRRWYVIKSYAKRKDEPGYYKNLRAHIDKDAGGVMKFLLARKIKDFDPGMLPETTEAKQFIVDQSKPDFELYLREEIDNENGVFKNDIVSVKDLFNELDPQYRNNRFITPKYAAKLFRKFGGVVLDKPVRVDGEVKKFFILRNHEKYDKAVELGTIGQVVKDMYKETEEALNETF